MLPATRPTDIRRRQTSIFLPFVILLTTRLALGLTYSLTVPIWESYDEDGHFAYARYLAKHRTLLQSGDPEAEQVWEKFQPPLYYILIAPAIAWLDLGEHFQSLERNPYMTNGDAGINYAIHPDQLRGTDASIALAVRIARALGAALSTASIIFVYLGARRIWPTQAYTSWAVTCLYAFWPQFLFVGSMVTNDSLVTSLAAVVFYLAITLVADGFNVQRTLLLGATLGGALLTKLNAVALIPPVGVAFVLSLMPGSNRPRHGGRRQIWLGAAVVGLLIAAALGLLGTLEFVTSQVFQLNTLNEFLRYAPGLGEAESQVGLRLVVSALRYGFRTFLASYGWGNLETYGWLYWLWGLGAGLSLLGLILGSVRHPPRTVGLRFLILMSLQFISPVMLTLALAIAYQDIFLVPGRYLLPALPVVSCLLIHGWQVLIPDPFRKRAWQALCVGVVLLGWSVPFVILLPAYARPQPFGPNAKVEQPLSVFIGDEINLIGYQHPAPLVPGQDFQISLCWRAVAPVTRNYSVFLEIVGPDGQGYGRLETYPGRGNYATTLWAVNTPFCDRYTITVGKDLPAPAAARVTVSLLNGVHGQPLPVKNATGDPVGTTADIPVKVQATAPAPLLAHPVEYRFGSGIVLSGYEIQPLTQGRRGVRVSLRWDVREDVKEDYVVFVHLRDAFSTAYAQDDSQPRQDWYPTSLWRAGETILDEHSLYFSESVSPSPLDLYVGLYAPGAAVRVPVFDAQGHPILNNEVRLAEGLSFP